MTFMAACPTCTTTVQHTQAFALGANVDSKFNFSYQPNVLVISLTGELALGRRAALSRVGAVVVYPLTHFAFPHAARASLQDGPHYVTHAVLTRDRARVNTHESAPLNRLQCENSKGPGSVVYQLTELRGNIYSSSYAWVKEFRQSMLP